jgi:hypothetical protein
MPDVQRHGDPWRMPITGLRIGVFCKYAIVLAFGVAIGLCLTSPASLERVANLARIDEINIHISNSFPDLRPEPAAIVGNPTDAGRVDEDLDYLIAKRTATLEGWQAFLAAHASGARAEAAEAEIDKLSLLVKASEPAADEVSDRVLPQAKVETEAAPPPSDITTLPPHEVCYDGGCPGGSHSDLSHAESTRFASDSESGKLRPQVASLLESPATAVDEPGSAATVDPDLGAKPRATTVHHRQTVSSRVMPPHRQRWCGPNFECHLKTRTLPPLILALLGVKPNHSMRAFEQAFAEARPSDVKRR